MKLTQQRLKEIIKEELSRVLNEAAGTAWVDSYIKGISNLLSKAYDGHQITDHELKSANEVLTTLANAIKGEQ